MKLSIGIAMLALAGAAMAADPVEVIQIRHNIMEKITAWRKCQTSDLVGLATLVRFDSDQTNEAGVEAVFKFTDRMPVAIVPNYRERGRDDSGEYVVTVPPTLRDPGDTSWHPDYLALPWKWKESESYVCFCRHHYAGGSEIYSLLWVLPGGQWEAFQEEVQKEQAEYAPYVKARKQELQALKEEFRAIWSRTDITEAEAEAMSREPRKRNIALRKELDEWTAQNHIRVNWKNLKTTWP